jgi:NAD(P)-dependent dehydrogenase (short-subunit alcohol dehydrogenase family)
VSKYCVADTAEWTEVEIPDLSGRTVLITGANSGLGLCSALVLARKGAKVLLACRNSERGNVALAAVAAVASTEPELVALDLCDLDVVRKAATEVRERTGDAVDILINNAGIMTRAKGHTADGFELQIGTNYLGHAALTWLLMPALRGGRVVTVSSLGHRGGKLDLDDLNFTRRRYSPFAAYCQSKLANLLFAFQLDRFAREHRLDLVSVAAHPGFTDTELLPNTGIPPVLAKAMRVFAPLVQSAAMGALPQLYAATAPAVTGGEYYGPDGFCGIRGYPTLVQPSSTARDAQIAQRLWDVTTDLTGVTPEGV